MSDFDLQCIHMYTYTETIQQCARKKLPLDSFYTKALSVKYKQMTILNLKLMILYNT